MFDRFGEFDSAEEMNKAVEERLKEGTEAGIEAVLGIAEENGIDKEDALDYINGMSDEFVTPLMAAIGKLNVEYKEYEITGILDEWETHIRNLCIEDTKMSLAVRRKGKSLAECMAFLIRFAFENKVQISNKIVDITKVTHNGKEEPMRKPLYLGVPTKFEARKLIQQYYLGK